MAVDVERLSGPEHQDGEEIGSADKGDDQRQTQHTRILLQTFREHWVL